MKIRDPTLPDEAELPPGMILRPLTVVDAGEAAEVIRTAFAAQSHPTRPPSSALSETAEAIAAKIAVGGGFGVFEAGALIAAALWSLNRDALHVARVSVAPKARGRGIVRSLIAACEAEAKRCGVRRMTLKTRLELPENERLFERCGFARLEVEAHPGFEAPTTAVMEKGPRVMDVMAPVSAPVRLRIDLGALAHNWRELARRAAPGRCAAVVKANAYGIGLSEAAPALWAAGARVFFVAHLNEGIAARRDLPAEAGIYVLNGLESGADPKDYTEHRLAPVIGGEEELKRWSTFAAQRGRPAPCALHLDTGMNRLGFDSLARLRAAMATHGAASGAELLVSHFVSSEIPGDSVNQAQIALFEAARAAFPNLPASLANSSGMFLDPRPIYDLARPGYALYGGNPTPGRPNPMRPVVTLTAAIQQTRSIEAGMTCGYNAQWTAKRPTRLATLLIGYADGLPRGAGATDSRRGAEVGVNGRRASLVGQVSMDLAIVDVTDLPEDAARVGDPVELFGGSLDLDEFASRSGTIGYHLLTSLGPRYRREYIR